MNTEKYEDLRNRSTESLEKLFHQERVLARQVIKSQVAEMLKNGEAMELSNEEERMLAEFRLFKLTCKPGALFKWQTRPEPGVILAPDRVLIHDPQGVDEGE